MGNVRKNKRPISNNYIAVTHVFITVQPHLLVSVLKMEYTCCSVCRVPEMHSYAHGVGYMTYIPEHLVCRKITDNLKLPP